MGGPITGSFEAIFKDITRPTFTGPNIGKWNLLFNYWKEYCIGNPSPILILEETLVALNLIMIASDLTGNISPLSTVLEETFALKLP